MTGYRKGFDQKTDVASSKLILHDIIHFCDILNRYNLFDIF